MESMLFWGGSKCLSNWFFNELSPEFTIHNAAVLQGDH
jgi:hypothetical protein